MADHLYEHSMDVLPAEAKALQGHIANVLCNFHVDSEGVLTSLNAIRKVFFDFLGIPADEDVRKIVGLMPVSTAFRHSASSTSPDDTRIAMIVGKPFVARRNKESAKEVALKQRYVVGIQVVNRSTVRMTSLHKTTERVAFNAMGAQENVKILEEGMRARPELTLCDKAYHATVAPIRETVRKGRVAYERLLEAFCKSLSIEHTRPFSSLLKFEEEPCDPLFLPRRMNTAFVESTVLKMKHKADMDVVEMLRPKRQKAVCPSFD
jgi:hypothetical protein